MTALIAGNWKMNGLTASSAELARGIAAGAAGLGCELLVCPPATQIASVAALLSGTGVHVGGQDCHFSTAGAHTGDISPAMLVDLGARHVILGHSERRADHHESSALVRRKAIAATEAGLIPIICVGETEAERRAGQQNQVVGEQLRASLPEGFAGIIAYEPVWAIGTGLTPSEADVAAMHGFIRATLLGLTPVHGGSMRILYGGSVKPSNAASLLGLADVGGALVGGASLVAGDFLAIAKAVG